MLGNWERQVVECDSGADFVSWCRCAVNGFGFIDFESPLFIPG